MQDREKQNGVTGVRGLVASAVVAAVTFIAVDLVWLGFIVRDLYVEQIGHLLRYV